MGFEKIIGQKEIITSLENALRYNRIGHAYIFSGPDGIGKKTVAGIFAEMLLCDTPNYTQLCDTPNNTQPPCDTPNYHLPCDITNKSQPCGACQACRLFQSGANPDFRIIRATESASIGIDDIRNIQGDVAIRPMYSKRKVYIIEEADKMTVQAQNCLLKTLEEPPPYVVIILTSSNYKSLLETIRSRAHRLSFKKNTHDQVRKILYDRYGYEAKSIEFAASYADGIIGTALDLVESDEFINLREKTFDIIRKIKSSRLSEIFSVYSFFEENKDDFNIILDMMVMYYRDMLVAKTTGHEKTLINSDKRDIIFNNVREYSPQQLISGIEQIEAARRAVKQNTNYQLVVEHMLIKLQED